MSTAHSDQPWETVDADFGFGPVTVYFRMWNYRERKILRKSNEDGADDLGVETLVTLGRKEDGSRIWSSRADREKIEREYHPAEIDRVSSHIITYMMSGGDSGN